MRRYDVMVCVSLITEIIFVLRTPVHAQSGYTCCVLINLHLHLCTELNCVIPGSPLISFQFSMWLCIILETRVGYKINWAGGKSA